MTISQELCISFGKVNCRSILDRACCRDRTCNATANKHLAIFLRRFDSTSTKKNVLLHPRSLFLWAPYSGSFKLSSALGYPRSTGEQFTMGISKLENKAESIGISEEKGSNLKIIK